MDNILYNISCKFLKLSGIFIDSKEFKVKLYSHENYPSLISLTDAVTDMGVQNVTVKTNINNLKGVEMPVLLHLGGNISRFIIATKITDNGIEYYKNNFRKEKKLIIDVLKDWDGVLLYVLGSLNKSANPQFFLTLLLLLFVLSHFHHISKNPFQKRAKEIPCNTGLHSSQR